MLREELAAAMSSCPASDTPTRGGSLPNPKGGQVGIGHEVDSVRSVLDCGSLIELLDVHQLVNSLCGCSPYHRVVITMRGHQRVVWHGLKEVSVAHLSRGSLMVIPANHHGRIEIAEDTSFCCVSISDLRMKACASAIGHLLPTDVAFRLGVTDRTAAAIVEMLGETTRANEAMASYICERALDLLCLQILREHSSSTDANQRPRGLASWHLRKVSEFVEPRLSRPLSLEDMASHVGLSRFHFCASFKMATGITPNEWLTIKRMDRAAYLLLNSNLCVLDISEAVGFASASAFSACFKRVMGVTPTAYRHLPARS